ncbi:MAG: hypothetical protein M0R80_17405 [Proteobacteria bacterium]|jgi:hypothetical protein|nr:hypothetical protein [Pseudomonadota bacterium]
MRTLIVTAALFAVSSAFPSGAAAQSCGERCDAAYASCAALEAAGCEIGGQLAGEAAEQLGNEIPIPGMGALFGALAHDTTAKQCVALLGPCRQIRTTCLTGCPQGEGQAEAGTAPAPAIRTSTLRVFSDRPRTIVYINEQRMGATPVDALEPFVSPELPVGRYWVRLLSPDGEWEWRGEKTVEEGNLNAVEGRLCDRRVALLEKAHTLDAAGETVRAAAAYRELLIAFPNDVEIKPEAEERLTALLPEFRAADEEMFRRIEAEQEPRTRATLCRVYLDEFAGGAFRTKVEAALAEAENAFPRPRQPGEPAGPAVDDRAQVEAAIGEDLGAPYAEWQKRWTARFPKYSDYMHYYYKNRRTTAIVFMVTYSVLAVGGAIAGAVLIPKGQEEKDEQYVIIGGVIIGVTGAFFLGSIIIGPIVAHNAKKNMLKLEAAGMGATALRRPRMELAGVALLTDARSDVRGLALHWEF